MMEDDKTSRLHAVLDMRRAKKLDAATKALEQLVTDYNGYAEAHAELASLLVGMSEQDQSNRDRLLQKAEYHASKATELAPSVFEHYSLLGNILFKSGRVDEARSAFRRGAKYANEDPWAHFAIAKALDSTDESAQHYREAIRLDPTNPDWRGNLGLLLVESGDYHDAISVLREAVEVLPSVPGLRHNLAHALAKGGFPVEAHEQYSLVIELLIKPNARAEERAAISEALTAMAEVSRQLGAIERAFSELRQATEVNPSNVWAQFDLASMLNASGAVEEANTIFRQVAASGDSEFAEQARQHLV